MNVLEFKKAIGYIDTGGLICELEDGRFALVGTDLIDKSNDLVKAIVSYCKYTFTRGKLVNTNVPKDMIEKAKMILNDSKANISERDDKRFKEIFDKLDVS